MASEKQGAAAGRNIKKLQAQAKRKTRTALEGQARKLTIRGHTTMGQDELRRAIARWR
jgi:hypothetical protein